jgi:hypothetical protein
MKDESHSSITKIIITYFQYNRIKRKRKKKEKKKDSCCHTLIIINSKCF